MEVMNVTEAAEYLRMSRWLVAESVRRRQIPHFRMGGRIFLERSALDAWIQEEIKKSTEKKNSLKVVRN